MLIFTKNNLLAVCLLNFCAMTFIPLAHATEKSHSTRSHHASVHHTTNKTQRKTPSQAKKHSAPAHTRMKSNTAHHPRQRVKNKKANTTKIKSSANKALRHSIASSGKKSRVLEAKKTAITKLMKQLGKPYHWGGASPGTGFDCSGLVYFAYKDLVNFHIPRTANGMYHLRDAAPVSRGDLKTGDLVFFRTEGRATADHVGVYIGNGKFIQSPRTGKDVQIASMDTHYWQRHYVGARRIVTPQTVR